MTTPEERIAKLEAKHDSLEAWVKSMDGKLDKLVSAADMGKGAWLIILKIGGALTVLAGMLAAMANAIAWLWDHIPKGH